MNGRLLFPLGRGLLALAFIGPGGTNLLEGWRAQQMSASAAVAFAHANLELDVGVLREEIATNGGSSAFL